LLFLVLVGIPLAITANGPPFVPDSPERTVEVSPSA
jgi:hypothetical protein